MNEAFFTELSAWLTQAGLAGTSETDIVSGLCDRCVAAGLPLARTQVFIDTLYPVHEGRLFRWGFGPTEAPLLDYGRTTPDALAASGSHPLAAVNETNRIAAMCRSVDQPVLMSAAFADVGNIKRRLVSVGRYALRGVAHPQELFTIDPYS
jgi:hypothetical protein